MVFLTTTSRSGFPVDVNITSKQEFSDHGRSWNTTPDRVGLSGPFAYQA